MRLGSVEYEKKGNIVIMTLDEMEKLNALSAEIREGLEKGFNMVDADDEVQLAIVTSAGRMYPDSGSGGGSSNLGVFSEYGQVP